MLGGFMPLIANVLQQVGYAGMIITSKLALEAGMKPLQNKTQDHYAYSFPDFFMFSDRGDSEPGFYFVGLENTTATVACALNNALPAATFFVLAALCRQEAEGIKRASMVAKVLGTLICVGGAMLLSFYHENIICIVESKIHWHYAEKMSGNDSSAASGSNFFLGPFLVMASAMAWAI
ncbi:Nodulin MtN21 /EamA-like transporter family protein isoform 2 [Hibiscus syriacus]|uniref:Nodulin MtN21 /EamA-like transporter family protein isoform 2 n=1 Tax=Hibiscus syriacus TaxID=106335 RepID=A0A6A2YL18_HIBSY|nr:Nodulin MtN21 /EamA-like transporter family protein isoform 2 [Hibiscus syriacus]